MKLILASKSAIRAEILHQVGVEFTITASLVDEEAIKYSFENASPEVIVQQLALAKAQAVSKQFPNDWVLGCDQVLVFEGEIFDKPADLVAAEQRLRLLRGKKHRLISALNIVRAGKPLWQDQQWADMHMRIFSEEFLRLYLNRCGSEICYSVGAYQFEGLGAQLFDQVDGDYRTILGLPTHNLLNYLIKIGFLLK